MSNEFTEIEGRAVVHTEVETIEFIYNGQIIKMTGTRVVTFADGEKMRIPITYESLLASLNHVPIQFPITATED